MRSIRFTRPGLPVLVLPAFAAFGYRGAQATVIALAACAGGLLWLIGWLATGDRRAAWFAWAAIAGSSTFLIQSVTIFPDLPAAAIVAAATSPSLCMLGRRPRSSRLADARRRIGAARRSCRGCTLASPCWRPDAAHCSPSRFFVKRRGRCASGGAARPYSSPFPPSAPRRWFLFFWMVYGTPNPAAPYGATGGDTRLIYAPGGFAGLLFDSGFGLFAYAPVLAAAVLAAFDRHAPTPQSFRTVARVIAALYLVAVGMYWQWWAGTPAPPARFAAAILPVFAIPLASVWHGRGLGRPRLPLARCSGDARSSDATAWSRSGALLWNVRAAPVEWISFVHSGADLRARGPEFFLGADARRCPDGVALRSARRPCAACDRRRRGGCRRARTPTGRAARSLGSCPRGRLPLRP